ncbi:MAG: 4Fe-4S dicluster domain-containing protein [Campylobacteraceae bacterium]|jgi:NAD-dependent dihydropyrimidine dehydrogenase PreA subunit|nr:4Fe-4S dicluster domain-containing protein [Campylobacteraceae bacterium]
MNVALYIGGAIIVLWFIGGIYRHVHGLGKIISVIDDNCTGCKCCLKKCHRNVLEPISEEKRAHIIVKNPLRCNACGDCVGVCKFKALKLIEKVN